MSTTTLTRPSVPFHPVLPGIALTAVIAGAAVALRHLPGLGLFSPMILSIVMGIAFHNLIGTPARAKEGVLFSMRKLLRLAIILLGLQLTVGQVVGVGARGIAIIALGLVSTFSFTVWLGARLGVERKLAELIAAGTSICGASAVIATNSVTQAPDEDVAYAVACVTVFGSLFMFTYPLLPALLHLSAHDYGLWAGASIHEIAQVVAAAFQGGREAGEFGTIAKLSRVMMLAPMVIFLGFKGARKSGPAPMPWFVLGFVALAIFNSVIAIPAEVKAPIATVTTFLLSMALAAMGLETDMRKLKEKGLRPLILGAVAALFIASFTLVLVKLAG
ncbi:MAG TPA: YeiH family protein [Magnetospirillaceae bacterium]|nr:YeiH family protein [Magnetospirillaceae bacterium]